MTVELTTPVTHDAKHDVDVQITNASKIFACEGFACLGLEASEVRILCEELSAWLKANAD